MATNNLSHYDASKVPSAGAFRFAIVTSDWNEEITHALRDGAIETLKKFDAEDRMIKTYAVPGTFELVYACQRLGESNYYDAIIAIGSVIRGETPHFDYVCSAAAQGIATVNASTETPTIFCVLTDENWEQAQARSGGDKGNKGIEAAIAAIQMAEFRSKFA